MKSIYWSERARKRVLDRYAQLLRSWPVPYRTHEIQTSQGPTFVLECGHPELPPLVLFHGGYCNSLMWSRSARAWAQCFRVLSVDIIGDPGFSAASRPRFSGDVYARWIDDVWLALGIDTAAVVGASLGGWLALDYAARRPGRVAALVALAPAGIVRFRPSSFLITPLLLLGRWGFKKAFSTAFGLDYRSLTGEELDFFEFLALLQRNVIGRTRLPTVLKDEALRTLSMPLKVLLGGRDVFFDARAVTGRLKALVPHAETPCLPEAGHGLTDTTAMVLDFLSALPARTGRDLE